MTDTTKQLQELKRISQGPAVSMSLRMEASAKYQEELDKLARKFTEYLRRETSEDLPG